MGRKLDGGDKKFWRSRQMNQKPDKIKYMKEPCKIKTQDRKKKMREASCFRLLNKEIKTTHISASMYVWAGDNEAECEWSVFTLINYINAVRQLLWLWSAPWASQNFSTNPPVNQLSPIYANLNLETKKKERATKWFIYLEWNKHRQASQESFLWLWFYFHPILLQPCLPPMITITLPHFTHTHTPMYTCTSGPNM